MYPVLGTDGVWDNIWELAIENVLKKAISSLQGSLKEAVIQTPAVDLVKMANGQKMEFYLRFAEEAAKWGHRYTGRKLDDATLVTCYVVPDSENPN